MTDSEKLDLLLNQIQSINEHMVQIETQGTDTFKELMNVETQVLKNQDAIKELNAKYDTLLLKADHSTLLLKLIARFKCLPSTAHEYDPRLLCEGQCNF